MRVRISSGRDDRLNELGSSGLVAPIVNRDERTGGRKSLADRAPEISRSAGHEHDRTRSGCHGHVTFPMSSAACAPARFAVFTATALSVAGLASVPAT